MVPLLCLLQINEERAVARRAGEMGAGIELKEESVEGIHDAIMEVLTKNQNWLIYRKNNRRNNIWEE